MNTKLHAVTDADGRPIRFYMTAGEVSDYTGAAAGAFVAKRGAKVVAVIGSLDVGFYTQYLEAFERGMQAATCQTPTVTA